MGSYLPPTVTAAISDLCREAQVSGRILSVAEEARRLAERHPEVPFEGVASAIAEEGVRHAGVGLLFGQ